MPDLIKDIIIHTSHRPWALPTGKWAYYQEWNRALFLHWKVSPGDLTPLVPANLTIDTLNNHAWISLVAFTMEKIRPNGIPAFAPISNFHEINVRTYVTADNKPGVYFLNIEAEKYLSAYIARKASGLPYEKAIISRKNELIGQAYTSFNQQKDFQLNASFETGNDLDGKTALDQWLTERYCLYLDSNHQLYRYQIHHQPWHLQEIRIKNLQSTYHIGNISLSRQPDLAHYSPGVKVIAWKREKVNRTNSINRI